MIWTSRLTSLWRNLVHRGQKERDLDEGLAARLLGGQAAGRMLVLQDGGVGVDLVVEVLLGPLLVDEVAPEAAQS